MHDVWNRLAYHRHRQLTQGADITFSEVLLPVLLRILQEQDDCIAFKILDVGCGTGYLAHILSEYVQRVVGIDPSESSVDIAREHTAEKRNVSIEPASVEDYAKSHRGQFDFAVAHMCLQAIEDLDLALRSISICLKGRGGFVFSIPHPCFWALIKEQIGQDDYNYCIPSFHLNSFRVSDELEFSVPYYHRPLEAYSRALSGAGFVIEELVEPFPDEELMEEYRRPWFYPGFFMVSCRKDRDVEVEDEQ